MRTFANRLFDVIVVSFIVGLVFLAFVLSHLLFWMIVADLTLISLLHLGYLGEGEAIKAFVVLLLVWFVVYWYDRDLDLAYGNEKSRERSNFNATFLAIAFILFLGDILSSQSYVMLPALIMLVFVLSKYLFCRHNSIVGWPKEGDD
jgi:hypothetical protein